MAAEDRCFNTSCCTCWRAQRRISCYWTYSCSWPQSESGVSCVSELSLCCSPLSTPLENPRNVWLSNPLPVSLILGCRQIKIQRTSDKGCQLVPSMQSEAVFRTGFFVRRDSRVLFSLIVNMILFPCCAREPRDMQPLVCSIGC